MTPARFALLCCLALTPAVAHAQTIEWLGTRALGMAGAFVGVADDATAVYWNPAGMATGATVSGVFELGRADVLTDKAALADPSSVATRLGTRMVATSATSFGVSTYRLTMTELVPEGGASTLTDTRRSVATLDRLTTSHYGFALLQTVAEGVVVGGTLKLVRGTAASAAAPASGTVDEALESAEDLPNRKSTAFDLDFGAMLVFGMARAGLLVRNLREPEFELPSSTESFRLKRHARVGIAVTPGRGGYAAGGVTVIGLDFDITKIDSPRGRQRDLSAGLEQWLIGRRIGLRGGIRVNTLDKAQRAGSAGLSFALQTNSYVEAHVTRGRVADDQTWSISARVTF